MQAEKNNYRSIFKLRDDVMLKIAAGEVIDRPFSVVRELLDNALDAGSNDITLQLEEGGKKRIRVLDNGYGMSGEDLEICFLPHTTSKIKENEDLYKIYTLGFRGEALSSISACSRLEITSKLPDKDANKLIVQAGNLIELNPSKGNPGTDVDVYNLFYNMPARKKFLKSNSAETTMCKNIFLDRAIAYPDKTFRLFLNEDLNCFFKPESCIERVCTAYSRVFKNELLDKIEIDEDDFKITAVIGKPEFSQKTRKYIQVFVNNRRIQEYSLMQAVEYSYSEYIPGGSYPAAFIFINIKPELVDFNIHPAKKEVKFLNRNELHKSITSGIKMHLKKYNYNIEKSYSFQNQSFENLFAEDKSLELKETEREYSKTDNIYKNLDYAFKDKGSMPDVYSNESNKIKINNDDNNKITNQNISGFGSIRKPKYIGSVFSLFLICEYNNNLYIIDQHAAHEKIIYNSLKEKEKTFQELLIPLSFDTSDEETEILLGKQDYLEKLGIKINKTGHNTFEITSLFSDYISINESELIKYLKDINHHLEELENKLLYIAACRKAVKEGDIIDRQTAEKIISDSFNLENARCPHGRPVWHIISREKLYKIFKRT